MKISAFFQKKKASYRKGYDAFFFLIIVFYGKD